MNCRKTPAYEFKTRLGFKQDDIILTKELSVLMKTKSLIEGDNIKRQYSLLGHMRLR